MIENFLYYGQWIILLLSILSLYMVSSVKHETRLNGYIFTGTISVFYFSNYANESKNNRIIRIRKWKIE